jgi:signal peptidase I
LSAVLAAVLVAAGCGGSNDKELMRFRLPSPSMSPTYKVGDTVTADLAAYKDEAPGRGDVLILYPPAGAESVQCGIPSEPADGRPCERPTSEVDRSVSFIQRVTGLPGEWLSVRNNRTYIGDRRLGPFERQEEPFIAVAPCDQLCNLPKPIRIPADHYYVMGDNRGEASDSRVWGPVPRSSIRGKVEP